MRIESIERHEDRLVKVVKDLVAAHGNQTLDSLRRLVAEIGDVRRFTRAPE